MPKLEFRGQQYTIKELSELSGIQPDTLSDRLRRGYSVEQADAELPAGKQAFRLEWRRRRIPRMG